MADDIDRELEILADPTIEPLPGGIPVLPPDPDLATSRRSGSSSTRSDRGFSPAL